MQRLRTLINIKTSFRRQRSSKIEWYLFVFARLSQITTFFSSQDLGWWRCIIFNSQDCQTSYMWIYVPWQLCSNPKLCQFIAGLFSFFHDTSQSKHLTSALQLQKKIKVLKCFFSGEIFYIFFSFLWERKAKKYVMHEQLETLLSKNGYSLKFKSCMRQKCNRNGIQEFTHLQQKTKQLKHEKKLLY